MHQKESESGCAETALEKCNSFSENLCNDKRQN